METAIRTKSKRKRISTDEESYNKKLKKMIDLEKQRLEKLVLGDESCLIRNITRALADDSGLEDDEDSESLYSDTLASPPRQPAWEDDEDNACSLSFSDVEGVNPRGTQSSHDNYENSLRKRFKMIFGEPSWARLEKPKTCFSSDEEDDCIMRSCGNFIRKSSDELPKSAIDAKRVASLNSQTRNEGPVVKAVEFHPSSSVALVAGVSGVASLFQVDGRVNSKLTSVHFERFPIRCAKFTKDGNRFIVGSNLHSHFHSYDMIEGRSIKVPIHHNMEQTNLKSFQVSPDGNIIAVRGRFGAIHLLTTLSYEWIGNLQMNSDVTAIAFNHDGSTLYSHGDNGEVYCWDMRRRCCSCKFWDEGCVRGTSVACSADGSLVACGSSTGVVNLYSTASLSSPTPHPLKPLMNLTTTASLLTFNSTSQLLAFGSDEKDNSIKICHVPSLTVFSNFPSFNTDLNRVQCASFSPRSGFLSIANNRSTAFLYRLKYFGNY